MSTTHDQVVWKCKGSEACESKGETAHGRETLRFWRNVAPRVAEVGSLFPRVRELCWKMDMLRALLEDEVGKMRTRRDLHFKLLKNGRDRSALGKLAKCARYCSQSSICISKNMLWCQNRKKRKGSEHFWKMKSEKCIDSSIHWFIGSLIHWCTDSSVHCFNASLIQCFIDSFIRWLIDSLVHPFIESVNQCITDSLYHRPIHRRFTDSLIHWFLGSIIHSFGDSLNHRFMDWCTDSLNHWFFGSLVHRLMNSLIHWFIDSLVRSISCAWIMSCHFVGISTAICSFVVAPHNFNASLLLHVKNFPIGHWFLIAGFIFSKFPPGMGRALPGSEW